MLRERLPLPRRRLFQLTATQLHQSLPSFPHLLRLPPDRPRWWLSVCQCLRLLARPPPHRLPRLHPPHLLQLLLLLLAGLLRQTQLRPLLALALLQLVLLPLLLPVLPL